MEKHGYGCDRTVFMIIKGQCNIKSTVMDATGQNSKLNSKFNVMSKESNRARSLLCIIIQFGSDNQLPEVARFLVFSVENIGNKEKSHTSFKTEKL